MTDEINTRPPPTDASGAVALIESVDAQPTLLNISRAARSLPNLRHWLGRIPLRIACAASFTFEPLKPALELQALRAGISAELHVAPIGRFDQELIDPHSALAAFNPNVVLLPIRLRDVCPAIHDAFNSLTPEDSARLIDNWLERHGAALRSFRQRCAATILIQNYELPASPALGIAEATSPHSQTAVIREANHRLQQLADDLGNAYVLDYDGLIARVGRDHWADERMRLFARIPLAARHYWRLSGFYVKHLRPLVGLTKKVLVLDADNTLWGGVVGDVGIGGIQLGEDFPGNAFVEFQKRILDLHHRGVVLALASKNDPGVVEQVLRDHPAMILRPEHFAAIRVNWNDKPANLRDMAAELNLGLDSFVFIDDHPVECDLMRSALPEVLTLRLPADPAAYPSILDSLDCFDQWSVSEEDRRRGELYRAESDRRRLQADAIDMPTFYRRLEMTLTLYVNHAPHIARAAQLTQRTNQFNMQTLRHSEDDIRRFMSDESRRVITVALADRFGDNGVIGMAVIEKRPSEWRIPIFLMSCRILGRTVEQTVLNWLAWRARDSGATMLRAEFVETRKNKPFADFYRQCGLSPDVSKGDIQIWELPLGNPLKPVPDWINLDVRNDDTLWN